MLFVNLGFVSAVLKSVTAHQFNKYLFIFLGPKLFHLSQIAIFPVLFSVSKGSYALFTTIHKNVCAYLYIYGRDNVRYDLASVKSLQLCHGDP